MAGKRLILLPIADIQPFEPGIAGIRQIVTPTRLPPAAAIGNPIPQRRFLSRFLIPEHQNLLLIIGDKFSDAGDPNHWCL